MSAEPTLGEAIVSYTSRIPQEQRDFCARELNRFGRWFGFEKSLKSIRPVDLETFQEQLGQKGVDTRKFEPLRQFLSDARAKKLLDESLAVHVRIRKKAGKGGASGSSATEAPVVRMTEAGRANLVAELERLEAEVRPQIQGDMQRAAADKDMRENAPYHAAKEALAEVQSKINSLKASLSVAQIVEHERSTQRVGMGSTVVVRDIAENEELRYTLVGKGEVNLRNGRISIESPMGRALSEREVGDLVEVETPSGRHHYRVEQIETS